MDVLKTVIDVVATTLQIENSSTWDKDTLLLGAIPEFDSMAVVSIITSLEDSLGIFVEDDEISAETFESLGSLTAFVEEKL